MTKGLIFNADDFGRSDEENLAIIKTASQGLVRSTTVMANMPAASTISRIRTQLPHLGIGVHLNLTEGSPVLDPRLVPTLVNRSGTFWPKRQLLWRSCFGLIRREEVVAELRAQILRVREWVGEVTHVDSHQNTIIFPSIMPAAIEVLGELGIRRVRAQKEYLVYQAKSLGDRYQAIGSDGLVRAIWSAVKKYRGDQIKSWGFRNTDFLLLGMPGYKDDAISVEQVLSWWKQILPHLPDAVFEVPTHPGFSPAEVAVLTDARMMQLLEAFNVRLLNFASI